MVFRPKYEIYTTKPTKITYSHKHQWYALNRKNVCEINKKEQSRFAIEKQAATAPYFLFISTVLDSKLASLYQMSGHLDVYFFFECCLTSDLYSPADNFMGFLLYS